MVNIFYILVCSVRSWWWEGILETFLPVIRYEDKNCVNLEFYGGWGRLEGGGICDTYRKKAYTVVNIFYLLA